MITMKKLALLTVMIGFMSLQLFAQQNKKEKIIELFAVMKSDKMVNTMMDNLTGTFKKSISTQGHMSERAQNAYLSYVMDEAKAMAKKLINDDMAEIYSNYFTVEEIQKLIDFYKTPEGQKLIELTPAIQKDLMTNVMNKYVPDLQEKFTKKMKELMKEENDAQHTEQ